jgi:hypothetical protein
MARFESFASIHFDKPYLVSRGSDDEGNFSFECKVCQTTLIAENVETHCASEGHKGQVRGAKNLQGNPFAFACIILHSRIDGLGSPIWRDKIRAELIESFVLCAFKGAVFDQKPEIKKAKELVSNYERRERVALLELAVWESICIATFQPNPENQGYHEWLGWTWHGWKSAKSKTQRCNEIGIIIDVVCSFLE